MPKWGKVGKGYDLLCKDVMEYWQRWEIERTHDEIKVKVKGRNKME